MLNYHVIKIRQKFEWMIRIICYQIELLSLRCLIHEKMLIRSHKIFIKWLELLINWVFQATYEQIQKSSCLSANWDSIFFNTSWFNLMFASLILIFNSSEFSIWKVSVVIIFIFLCFSDDIISSICRWVTTRFSKWNRTYHTL